MQDWNVLVSVHEDCYGRARQQLQPFGTVHRTDFHNVLALTVPDTTAFLEALRQTTEQDETLRACLGRVMPVTRRFAFQTPAEFEERAGAAFAPLLPQLANKTFYVRMHRRGFRNRMSSQDEERTLGRLLLEALAQQGVPGRLTFHDPDAVVAIETIGASAGIALWTREDLARYPFLRVN